MPKTSNALESFFGHLKDNLRIHRGLSFEHQQAFVKWYLHFNNEKKKMLPPTVFFAPLPDLGVSGVRP